MRKQLLVLLIGALPLICQAQKIEDAPLPTGPLIAPAAPSYSSWTQTFTYTTPEPDPIKAAEARKLTLASDPELAKIAARNPFFGVPRPRITNVVSMKTGDIKEEVSILSAGQKDQRWQSGNIIIQKDGITGSLSINFLNEGQKEEDFPELAWISAKDFKGIKKVEGKSFMLFSATIPQLALSDPRSAERGGGLGDSIEVSALVDLDTRLPVSLIYGGLTRAYTFGAAPSQQLSLPPDLAAELQKAEKRNRVRNAGLGRP